MTDEFLGQLRCPLDPQRDATLSRDEQFLACDGCGVHFPMKQGLPILIPDEAELPPGLREVSQLPCQRRENRRKAAN